MTTETDTIYFEPGSVWRQGDEWRTIRAINNPYLHWRSFDRVQLSTSVVDWLAWAKHPDTVLVYSPNQNKLPVKPGWVRKRIPFVIDKQGDEFHSNDAKTTDYIVRWYGVDGTRLYVEFDAKLPVPSEPETVEGTVEQ